MAAVSPSYLVGKNISVKIDGTAYPTKTFKVGSTFGTFNATNGTSGGNADPEATIQTTAVQFTMPVKATAGNPGFSNGSIYAFEVIQTGTTKWSGNLLITDCSNDADAEGGIMWSISGTVKGATTFPTGP